MAKVKIKQKKQIKGEQLKEEDKNTVVPISGTGILAIILRENKSAIWKWLPHDFEHFQVGKHTYFKEPRGTYLSENRVLLTVYIEGISIPISHQYIEKKIEEREYIDAYGEVQKVKVAVIQNIKFDSEIVDMLLNRNLADEFLKETTPFSTIGLIILISVNLALTCVGIGLHFYGG